MKSNFQKSLLYFIDYINHNSYPSKDIIRYIYSIAIQIVFCKTIAFFGNIKGKNNFYTLSKGKILMKTKLVWLLWTQLINYCILYIYGLLKCLTKIVINPHLKENNRTKSSEIKEISRSKNMRSKRKNRFWRQQTQIRFLSSNPSFDRLKRKSIPTKSHLRSVF